MMKQRLGLRYHADNNTSGHPFVVENLTIDDIDAVDAVAVLSVADVQQVSLNIRHFI